MNRCPITYNSCGSNKYSHDGLKKLSRNLKELLDIPYSSEEQIREAVARASKMSIQGVQPKLSAVLNVREKKFLIKDRNGKYILKPQNHLYPHIPENEDLTMKLAALSGIEVPLTGLVYSRDNSFTYFIKRFDRKGKRKIHMEDFAQLSEKTRDTKYDSSMEKISLIIEKFATFPVLEKRKLFLLTIFNFLIGNEDMHLKNFSIIEETGNIKLSPAYDLINTTIVLNDPEEIALPIDGKKRKLNREIFIEYYGSKRLGLNNKTIETVLNSIIISYPKWIDLINISFLPDKLKKDYIRLVDTRMKRLGLK
ncbi:MAG: HipA domain-containing protein [Acidobacteriota bacterium]